MHGSKLTYGLFTAAFTSKAKRRIDGFQARCLRKILKIPHSYYSRISNQTVLEIAAKVPLSEKIQQQQFKYMEKIAARSGDDPARLCVFEPGSENFKEQTGTRSRGRPRTTWRSSVCKAWSEEVGN